MQIERDWNIEASAALLQTQAIPIKDALDGDGYRLLLERPYPAQLDFHPERLVVRYRSILAQLQLAHVHTVKPAGAWLRIAGEIESAKAALAVNAQGVITFSNVFREQAREAGPATRPDARQGGPGQERSARPERKQERVEYRGRLGFTPQLSTNDEGIDFITLSVAVKDPQASRDAKPDWRQTLFYRERAHRVAELHLQKGEMVEIVAYKDIREVPTRQGKVRRETVYNGTVIHRI